MRPSTSRKMKTTWLTSLKTFKRWTSNDRSIFTILTTKHGYLKHHLLRIIIPHRFLDDNFLFDYLFWDNTNKAVKVK